MKNSILLALALLSLSSHLANAQYCTPSYSAGCSLDAIQYFSLKGEGGTVIYNNSGSCTTPYSDFTASLPTVTMSWGTAYSGFIRTSDPNNYVSIWIDQNNNNTFESTERILNNLQIGTSNLLYSIYIPNTFATGMHRMRVRNVYYGITPSGPTDPCSLYTYGETEDYMVNITNSPGSRLVANGIPGSCMQSSVTTIDAGSNNNNFNNIGLLDSANNLVAGVYPSGNSLGRVSASVYVHNGLLRQTSNGAYYLDRNITINSSVTPLSPFNLRLYYRTSELNTLIAQPGSGVTSQFDLSTTRNNDLCQASLSDPGGSQLFPTGYGAIGGDKFLDFSNLTNTGSYYFSGPSLVSSCQAPSNPVVNLSSPTAGTFSWTAPTGGASGYQYAITTSATPPGSGAFTTLTSVAISSLIAGQLYYAHVKSVCGSAASVWTSTSFTTVGNDLPCNAMVLVPGGPTYCENTTTASSVNDPSLSCSLPNNTLWYQFTPSTSGTYSLQLSIPSSGDPLNGWIAWYTATGVCPSLSLTQFDLTCSNFGQSGNLDVDTLTSPALTAGVTYYIMVDGFSGDVGNFCIQLLQSMLPPLCTGNLLPANGATNVAIPGSSTTLSWNPAAGATSYEVYFGTDNPPNLYGIYSTASLSIEFLSYNQTYYWYVVPQNSSGSALGCSSTQYSFTTANPTNCVPLYVYGCAYADSLSYFSLKGESGSAIYNNSGNTCQTFPITAYSDYTTTFAPVIMSINQSYAGFMKTGYPGEYVSIWIDFNDNGYFEDNERLLNNLAVGTTELLYSIYIPNLSTLGNHRMRVRNVYYGSAPSAPTHPCNPYYYGETEDYMVTITNTQGPRTVAPGVAGTCQLSSATTIDIASNNSNALSIPLLDSMNRYVCRVYPLGNEFGTTSAEYYVHDGAVRQNGSGSYYLNRNLHLNVTNQPSTSYNFRFFYRNSELNSLITQVGSGVSSPFDLGLLQNDDVCSAAISNSPNTRASAVGFGNLLGDHSIDFTNLNTMRAFYLLKDCIPNGSTDVVNACSYLGGGTYTWNGTTYVSSGTYSLTFTNVSGCDSVATLQLTIGMYPNSGTATANPSSICAGDPVNLSYQPACTTQIGFDAYYSPVNWSYGASGNSNGYISSYAPNSIYMVSSDGLFGDGSTYWSIMIPCSGTITFNWNYSTVDGALYDYPRYWLNSNLPSVVPGYNTSGPFTQSGTSSISVNAGDIFTLDIYSTDNQFGPCTVSISNFEAPVQGVSQNVDWYSDVFLNNYVGSGNNFTIYPSTPGTFTYYAQVQDIASGCINPSAVATDTVHISSTGCNTQLTLSTFLQGYYAGGGLMNPVLFNQGVSVDNLLTDQITVELRDPTTLLTQASVVTDLAINGSAICNFPSIAGYYYIVIRHRNSIETWSSLPVLFISGSPSYYSFSSAATQAYGANLIEVGTGVWAIYSGDLNQEENIDLLDASLLEVDINNFAFGYYSSDINGDGNVDLLDAPVLENNINNFIYSIHP